MTFWPSDTNQIGIEIARPDFLPTNDSSFVRAKYTSIDLSCHCTCEDRRYQSVRSV